MADEDEIDEADVDGESAGGVGFDAVAVDGIPRAIRLTLVGSAVQALREVARLMRPDEANAPTPREALAHDRVADDAASFVTIERCHVLHEEGRGPRGGRRPRQPRTRR